MYIGNVVLTKSNVSDEVYCRIIDFVNSLTGEQQDMVAELQDMYADVSAAEQNYDEVDNDWDE
jgi:hypothetical protein